MSGAYLDKLNDNQRSAVCFGDAATGLPPPLLVIAGAGSGKTSALAHRVAHLLVKGADPRRIVQRLLEDLDLQRLAPELSFKLPRTSGGDDRLE